MTMATRGTTAAAMADVSRFLGQYKLQPGEVVVDPSWPVGTAERYGAKGGDPTYDSGPAIQAALNAAASNGSVRLGPKPYYVGAPIVFPEDKPVRLRGAGMNVTTIVAGAAMARVLYKANTNNVIGSAVNKLSIDGGLLATYGIEFQRGKEWDLDRVRVSRTVADGIRLGEDTTGFAGFYGAKLNKLWVNFEPNDYPVAANRPDYGLNLLGTATDNEILQFECNNPKTAGIWNQGGSNTFNTWHIYGFPLLTYYPLYALKSSGGQLISIAGYSDGVSTAGISLSNTSSAIIVGNRFYWPSGGTAVGAYPVEVTDINSTNITVVGNTMLGEDVNISRFVKWPNGTPLAGCIEAWNSPEFGAHSFRGSLAARGFNTTSDCDMFITTVGAGRYSSTRYQDVAGERWRVGKDNTAETGSNVGSDYFIERDNDAGAAIDRPFKITRATGNVKCTVGGIQTGQTTTAARPSAATLGAGTVWYDTTLHKPIFSDGASWRDATGTVV